MILNCSNPSCATMFMPSFGVCPTCGSAGNLKEFLPVQFSEDDSPLTFSRFDVGTGVATFLAILVWHCEIVSYLHRTQVDDNPVGEAMAA